MTFFVVFETRSCSVASLAFYKDSPPASPPICQYCRYEPPRLARCIKPIYAAPKMLWLLTGDDGSQAQAGVSCLECEASRALKIESEMLACGFSFGPLGFAKDILNVLP